MRVFNGASKPATSDPISVTMRLVKPLLIYQTRYTELNWFENDDSTEETLRPDLLYADMSKEEIIKKTKIAESPKMSDFDDFPMEQRINGFKNMAVNFFANKTFEPIITDMIDHFVLQKRDNFVESIGKYSVYENAALTEQIRNHKNSQKYVSDVILSLKNCLKENNVDIDSLEYDTSKRFYPELRKDQTFLEELSTHNGGHMPVFDDLFTGYKICIDSLHSTKIEVTSFSKTALIYSGVVRITYYDHFGLDIADIDDYIINTFFGFRQWFIMQHWKDLGVNPQPKPFVTRMTIESAFAFTI